MSTNEFNKGVKKKNVSLALKYFIIFVKRVSILNLYHYFTL